MRGIQFRKLCAVALMAISCLLAGCADLPIYSPARDKQGQDVKKAWSEVDVKSTISVARENLAALLAKQLATQDKLSQVKRDELIRSLATGGTITEQLIDPTNQAMADLAGTPELAAQWFAAWRKEQVANKAVSLAARLMSDEGVELPPCSKLASPEALAPLQQHINNGGPKGKAVKDALTAAKNACASENLAATSKVKVQNALAATLQDLEQASNKLEEQRAETRNLRNGYMAALDAHTKAANALKTSPHALKDVQDAAAKLEQVAQALSQASTDDKGKNVYTLRFLSQARADSLQQFLATVADAKPDQPLSKDASKAAVALVLLPNLFDETQKGLAEAKTPTLTPLVLRMQYEKIRYDAATRDISAQEARVALLNQKLALQTEQAQLYVKAMSGFDKQFANKTLEESLGSEGNKDRKNSLLNGTGAYLDADTRVEGEVIKVQYRMDYAAHERAIAYAEANASQWQALIGSSVDQLSDYGTSGVKPEMLISLFNSLTLLWIGMGVN